MENQISQLQNFLSTNLRALESYNLMSNKEFASEDTSNENAQIVS